MIRPDSDYDESGRKLTPVVVLLPFIITAFRFQTHVAKLFSFPSARCSRGPAQGLIDTFLDLLMLISAWLGSRLWL